MPHDDDPPVAIFRMLYALAAWGGLTWPYPTLPDQPVTLAAGARQKLDRFCEILVDYVSAGHFEIYCELLDEGGRRFLELIHPDDRESVRQKIAQALSQRGRHC